MLSHNLVSRMNEERDLFADALNNLQIATRTGNTELVLDADLIGDVMMLGVCTPVTASFREWCLVNMDRSSSGQDMVVPRDFVADVLTMPMFQNCRLLFRQWCDANLASVPGIDDLTRSRLRRMIASKGVA